MADLTFAYDLGLLDEEGILGELATADADLASVWVDRLVSGSHVAGLEVARIGFRGEADLLVHKAAVWLERGTDPTALAGASARRVLESFLHDLRRSELADAWIEDMWPRDAQVRLDPMLELRVHQTRSLTPEYLRASVASVIRRLRKDRQMTQAQVAATTGLTTQQIGAVERPRGPLVIAHVGAIANALGVPVSEIFRLGERTDHRRPQDHRGARSRGR